MTGMSVDESGVPSQPGDGTPVCLAPELSADALDALEFAAALECVASHAAGPLGATQLRRRLPSGDAEWIRGELATVGEVLVLLRRGADVPVVPVPELHAAIARLRVSGGVLELVELGAVKATLAAGRRNAEELAARAEECPRLARLAVPCADRAIERMLDRAIGPDDELLDSASPALAEARRGVHVARERLIRKLEAVLRDTDPAAVPGSATVTMRGGRYVIPLRRDSRHRPEGIVHDESGSAGTLFVEPTAAIELGNALRAAVVAEERETLAVLRDLTARLRPSAAVIAALHAMSVEFDTIVARARWARATGGEVPTVGPGTPLRVIDARHPLLLARGIDVIPFDLVFEGTERTLLISGPNTGGKTVLLKTVGLAVALVQAGCVPPIGAGSALPVMRGFFVDIGDHQSLAADLSTFSAHVVTLRRILDVADASILILLDEIGSGTDPAEGGALAMAVLETLTARGALTLATTHLGSLKLLATRVNGVVNGSLEFDAATLSPTYRFSKGVPGRSYGLAIARRLGVNASVLAAAEALVPDADRELDQLLAAVEVRRQALERSEAELADRLGLVERREAVAAATAADQQERETTLRQQEKQAARDQARQAKAYLLEARRQVEAALAMARGAADQAAARDARRLVEDAIRSESERVGAGESSPVGGVELQVGSRVRLNTGAAGELAELRGDGKAVVLVGAMRLVVAAGSLAPIPESMPSPRHPATTVAMADVGDRPARYELDLRGMRADEAVAAVTAAIDGAVMSDQPHLAIIHGMGTGVLRDTVRDLLAADRRVASFEYAPRQQGGVGVTVATFR